MLKYRIIGIESQKDFLVVTVEVYSQIGYEVRIFTFSPDEERDGPAINARIADEVWKYDQLSWTADAAQEIQALEPICFVDVVLVE